MTHGRGTSGQPISDSSVGRWRGQRGWSASQWSARTDYLNLANAEICVLVQAETVTALQNLEAIYAVDRADGVFIGPADFSTSMGYRGYPGHPQFQAPIEQAMRTIVAFGKAAGTLMSDPTLAHRYFELGCTFVEVGIDLLLFASVAR